MALDIDAVIDGKYQIVRLLGEGGMGAVYEGLNVRIHRKVAIKVLHGNVAKSADAVQRFEREAQAAGRIGSKHIVEVLDLGDLPGGDRYMVMEFLEGESLADRIKARGQLSPQELYAIAAQLLEGLAAAHAVGIVHRDLKPDNVFLLPSKEGQPDFVKILDFGISKFNALGGEFSMTRTGAVMGTPYYMSPEQAKGARELDQRTDLYAVGVILYEALSGRVPFHAETFNELLFKIVLEDAPSLESLLPDVNPAFVQIVSKAMARDADQRYQTASDFKAALSLWLQRGSIAPLGIVEPAPTYGTSLPSTTVVQGTTSGAWSQTGKGAAARKNQTALYVGIAVAALLAVGGGGALLLRGDGESEQDTQGAESFVAAQPAALDAAPVAPQEAAPDAPLAPKEVEGVEPASQEAQPERASAATAKKTAASDKKATPSTAPKAPVDKKSEPAPSPSSSSTSSTSTGRPIRTSL